MPRGLIISARSGQSLHCNENASQTTYHVYVLGKAPILTNSVQGKLNAAQLFRPRLRGNAALDGVFLGRYSCTATDH